MSVAVDVRIDRATPADVPSIAALDAAAFLDRPWSTELWATEVAGHSWVAVVREPEAADPDAGEHPDGAVPEGEVAGVIAVSRTDAASEVADLDRVIVRPGARGRGLGEALVRAGLAWASAQGAARVLLEVERTNATARRLYERCGFAAIGTRRNYYGPGRDAVVMEAVVQPAVGIEDEGRRG